MAARARPFSRFWFVLALAASLPALPPSLSCAWGGTALIYVTNSAGDSIHVIDPVTNKVSRRSRVSRRPMASRRRPTVRGSMSATKPIARSMCSTAKAVP